LKKKVHLKKCFKIRNQTDAVSFWRRAI